MHYVKKDPHAKTVKVKQSDSKKTLANGTRHLAISVSLLAGEKYVNMLNMDSKCMSQGSEENKTTNWTADGRFETFCEATNVV